MIIRTKTLSIVSINDIPENLWVNNGFFTEHSTDSWQPYTLDLGEAVSDYIVNNSPLNYGDHVILEH